MTAIVNRSATAAVNQRGIAFAMADDKTKIDNGRKLREIRAELSA